MTPYDSPGSLLGETLRLLKDRQVIEIHTSTGIPFHWLSKLKQGTYRNPSVNRIQFLYEFLSGSPLLNASKHTGRTT